MIKLYSNHCSMCDILKESLDKANIIYEEINDEDLMLKMGMSTMPMLGVPSKTNEGTMELLNYAKAIKWLDERRDLLS